MNFEQLKNFLAALALLMIFMQIATCSTAFGATKATAADVPRSSSGRIHRSSTARTEFKKSNPCPATGRTRLPCPGYQIDHVAPLCAGGADHRSNMQWLTIEAHRAKTRWDVRACRTTK